MEKDYQLFLNVKRQSEIELKLQQTKVDRTINYKDKSLFQQIIDINKKKKTFNLLENEIIKVKSDTVDTDMKLKELAKDFTNVKKELTKEKNKIESLELDIKFIR